MPLQNRVTPEGELIATTARGTMMGNRGGVFHRDDQTLLPKRWRSKQWICCVLDFKGRRRPVMQPRRYTELFFLDEATALSAGHRPCFECRREAAVRFATLWNRVRRRDGRAAAPDMDLVLHAERTHASDPLDLADLPDNAFVRWRGQSWRVCAAGLQAWSPEGYARALPRPPNATVGVLTPRSILQVLGAGYRPVLHDSAAP
jgi:hypothetical protein